MCRRLPRLRSLSGQDRALGWASSTPVTAKGEKTLDPKINPTIVRQNEIAARVAQARGVPINDLYSLGAANLELARGDQFHWTPQGSRLFAKQVAREVTAGISAGPGTHARQPGEAAVEAQTPLQLASPDGRLVMNFAVADFDGSTACPTYSVTRDGQPIRATSKLALTFGGAAWRDNVTVTAHSFRSQDHTWQPVYGERSTIRDHFNELTLTLRETAALNRLGAPHSLVSALSGNVSSPLPLTMPWRYVMAGDSPGRLLENNDFILNLNDPCALTNTAWIKPGKVIRDVTLSTAGGVACVDFAVKRNLQYIEFDAGWYGPENATPDAARVNLDPARSPGPLDLPYVINYAASNGIGVILFVNKVALERQLDILPALYRSWGVTGMKFGFVIAGSQAHTAWLHDAIRKCADHQIMVDVHEEYRPTGWQRSYPNLMTVEGIRGDEETPTAAQDSTTLFTRMIAGAGDHAVCYFDRRVTNNWNRAYQLAKAVIFYSPWQFLYWYDRPPESPIFGGAGGSRIVPVTSDEPELEFYDAMPKVWDDTKVLQGAIGQYAVVARRSGEDWFIGAMNAGAPQTLEARLDFLTPGRDYIAHRYSHDPSLTTRTRVRIDRVRVTAADVLQLPLDATSGEAIRITPPTGDGGAGSP